MPITAGDGRDAAKILHLDRRATLCGGPVTQIAFRVVAPGPDRAVGLERQAMKIPAGEGGDAAQVLHLHRRDAPQGRGPVTQLAKFVKTPGPDRAVVPERQTVLITYGDGRDSAQILHLDRRGTVYAGPVP